MLSSHFQRGLMSSLFILTPILQLYYFCSEGFKYKYDIKDLYMEDRPITPLFTAVPVTSSLVFNVVAAYLQTAGLKSTVANQTGLWEAVARWGQKEGTKVIYSTSYEEQCYGSRLELKWSRSLGSVPRLAWRGGILISVILYFLLKFKYKPMAWAE